MRVIPYFSALTTEFAQQMTLSGASRSKRCLIRSYIAIAAWDFDEDWSINHHPDCDPVR